MRRAVPELILPISPRDANDINVTLDRLRYARQLDPDHNEKSCPDCCEVCILTRRLDWLLETKVPRKAST